MTTTDLLDITSVSATDVATIKLTHGNGDPLLAPNKEQVSITVYGPGSDEYCRAASRRQNWLVEKMRKKGGKLVQTAEEKLEQEARFLAAITISFNGFAYPPADGKTGFELFRAAYSDPKIGFIKDQVAEFAGDWENFSAGSAMS